MFEYLILVDTKINENFGLFTQALLKLSYIKLDLSIRDFMVYFV